MTGTRVLLLVALPLSLAIGVDAQTRLGVVTAVAPEYPDLAMYAHIQGIAKVRVAVDELGRPGHIAMIEGHKLLEQSAQAAARLWTFEASAGGGSRSIELTFGYLLLAEDACWQKTLPRFLPPYRVEVGRRRVTPPCDDCAPRKPIKYETCL